MNDRERARGQNKQKEYFIKSIIGDGPLVKTSVGYFTISYFIIKKVQKIVIKQPQITESNVRLCNLSQCFRYIRNRRVKIRSSTSSKKIKKQTKK